MIKGWKKSTLGEACHIEKGKASAANEPVGIYPLVTTSEARKSAATWQLEGPAVCVPLISAFGHGKPGLKRVHYQEGKFALANILCAMLAKNPKELSARFLAVFLNFYKDQLIVPLQFGAANMSVTVERLATVPIWFPALDEQERIVRLLDEAESLHQLRAEADTRMEQFVPALFYEMFGNPVINEKNWVKKTISDIGKVITGNTPPTAKKEYYGDEIEWIKSDNINTPSDILTQAKVYLSKEGKKIGRVVPPGSVLVTCIAGNSSTIGNAAIANREVAFNQQINAITPNELIETDFLYAQILALRLMIKSASSGGMKGIVSKSALEKIFVIVPPLALQREFAARVGEARGIQSAQARSAERVEALYQSMLSRAFAGEL